jgi:hypothetical protein
MILEAHRTWESPRMKGHIRERRVLERVPELVEELVGQVESVLRQRGKPTDKL